jgi:Translation initiation factor 1 (eIF-1/SUI1) and related proteins
MRLFEGTPFDRPPRCERCDQLESECQCPPETEHRTPAEKQTARLQLENRKGKKQVTTIRGLLNEGTHLHDLLSQLKTTCGAGGSIQEETLELQGDQRERAAALLRKLGYKVKST